MFRWFYEKKQALQEKIGEKGQGIVEYALILAAVAIIAIYVLTDDNGVTGAVDNAYSSASSRITQAAGTDLGSGGGT